MLRPADDSALAVIAACRDPGARLLSPEEGAVELINILCPMVAVGRYIAFLGLALHEHPETASASRRSVALEARRFYPFFPPVGGRVREPFTWRDYHFPLGRRVLLDLYGTNRDPAVWDAVPRPRAPESGFLIRNVRPA